MNKQLHAISFAGITPDTLGGYLCGLGLLSACAQVAPSIRGCWRDDSFILVAEQLAEDVLMQHLLMNWDGPIYDRIWAGELEQDRALVRRSQMPAHLAGLRSVIPAHQIGAMDSNVVTSMRPVPNPIFGDSAGKVGAQRDFSKVLLGCMGFINAGRSKPVNSAGVAKNLVTQIRELGKRDNRQLVIKEWLNQTLHGVVSADLPALGSTGTWFPFANKTFNSGQDGFFREGRLSPWSFLLALEGALLLRGEIGRRLSAIARPYAAFPFISEAPNPIAESNVGLKRAGVFWAPIWDTPATLTELRALLKRGLARIGRKTATAPHEFAVAALGIGVDAGVVRFAPFELRETTSSQVFEAMPMPHILVRSDERSHRAAELISSLVQWMARLPYEPTSGKKKGKFSGLRGPVEQAIIAVSEQPEDASRWQELLLKLAQVQKQIDWDGTRGWRQRSAPFPRLSQAWLDFAWPDGRPQEIEIATAIASIGGGTFYPLACNIYGVKPSKQGFWFPKDRPLSAVWHEGNLADALGDILHRRLVDHGSRKKSERAPWPLTAKYAVAQDMLDRFLNGGVDDAEIGRWLPALSLLDWHRPISNRDDQARSWSGLLALDGLFRPLLTAGLPWKDSSHKKMVEPDTTAALKLTGLLRQGDMDSALDFAVARYRALDAQPVPVDGPASISTTAQRLLAALLIPISRRATIAGRTRWILNTTD